MARPDECTRNVFTIVRCPKALQGDKVYRRIIVHLPYVSGGKHLDISNGAVGLVDPHDSGEPSMTGPKMDEVNEKN